MFKDMRSALSVPPTTDILTHISTLPLPSQPEAHSTLRDIETRYMHLQRPQPGLQPLMDYLDSRSVRKAIWTRNWDRPVQSLLDRFLQGRDFVVVTREWGGEPKPGPAGMFSIAEGWGLRKEEGGKVDATGLIMVGDSMDDMLGGRNAGAATVLLLSEHNADVAGSGMVDLVIEQLDELIRVLEEGFVGIGDGVEDGAEADEA